MLQFLGNNLTSGDDLAILVYFFPSSFIIRGITALDLFIVEVEPVCN